MLAAGRLATHPRSALTASTSSSIAPSMLGPSTSLRPSITQMQRHLAPVPLAGELRVLGRGLRPPLLLRQWRQAALRQAWQRDPSSSSSGSGSGSGSSSSSTGVSGLGLGGSGLVPLRPAAAAAAAAAARVRVVAASAGAGGAGAAAAAARDDGRGPMPSTPWGAAAWVAGGVAGAARRQVAKLDGLWGRFLPMCGLFFLLAFVNTLLDSIKDSLVITAAGGGTEVIPFLTVYAVLPCSLLFLVGYSYCTQRFGREALFNLVLCGFLAFYGAFALAFPNHEALHSHALAARMAETLPAGLGGLVGMVKNWTFTLFYCFSELWGDVMLSLLFWGLANETTPMKHAPIMYPLFGIGANVAQTLAGRVLSAFSRGAATPAQYVSQIQAVLGAVCVLGFFIMWLHAHIVRSAPPTHEGFTRRQQEREWKAYERETRRQQRAASSNGASTSSSSSSSASSSSPPRPVQAGPACVVEADMMDDDGDDASSVSGGANGGGNGGAKAAAKKKKGREQRLSLREAFTFLARSPQIRCLAVMALAQGVSTNLIDLAWKTELRLLHPTPAAYSAFMGEVAMWTGIVTGSLMFASPLLFDALGWKGVAGATPRFMLAMGVPFFLGCTAFHYAFGADGALRSALGIALLKALVACGALLQVFSKGAKFSLFKPAEEMVYIGLDEESRTKGKAAIDVVGAQSGKSVGSLLQQVLLLASGGALTGMLPLLAVAYYAMLRGWLRSVDVLGTHYDPSTHHAEDNDAIPPAVLQTVDDFDDLPGGGGSGGGGGGVPVNKPATSLA